MKFLATRTYAVLQELASKVPAPWGEPSTLHAGLLCKAVTAAVRADAPA